MNALRRLALALLVTQVAACGGGGSSPPPPPASADGLYQGALGSRPMSLLVLGSRFYLFYGASGGSLSAPAGVVAGGIQGDGSTLASTTARDFSVEGRTDTAATLTAAVAPRQSVSGTLIEGVSVSSFAGSYDSSLEGSASLSSLQGSYAGALESNVGIDAVVLNISGGGAINGLSGLGCIVTGNATVRAPAIAYDVRLNFNGLCLLRGQSLDGNAFVKDRTLFLAAFDPGVTTGIFFVGSKP